MIKDGVIYSDGTTILGADDRCAIAGYLEAINTIQENGISCGPIELILTVSEQRGLKGAHALDITKVISKEGYVLTVTVMLDKLSCREVTARGYTLISKRVNPNPTFCTKSRGC